MEDMQQSPSHEYVERFNQGYIIAKHKPELASALIKVLKETEGFLAFKSGMEEYELEQRQLTRKSWLSPERSLENKGAHPDMDKESLDKD